MAIERLPDPFPLHAGVFEAYLAGETKLWLSEEDVLALFLSARSWIDDINDGKIPR